MQRLASLCRSLLLPVLIAIFVIGLTSCGGGGGSSSGGSGSTNTLVIIPTGGSVKVSSLAVPFGDVVGAHVQLQDSTGTAVNITGSVTWTTGSSTIAGVTQNGALCSSDSSTQTTCICGGQWQNSNVDCIPPSATSTTTITATLSSGETATINVLVHPRVSRIEITTPPTTDCTSSTGTLQLAARAVDANGNSINLDSSAFTWFSSDSSISSVDTNGLVTAANPGKNNIYAQVRNTTSSPYAFATCAVKSLNLHLLNSTDTSYTVGKATTQTLAVDVTDTKGKTISISGARLTYSSNVSGVVSVDQNGLASNLDAGSAGIVVSCAPSNCNTGYNSVFSNVVTANVNGTGTPQVLVANSAGTSLQPFDTSTSPPTAGTALTLPYTPNSLIYANSGTKAFLGSGTTLMVYDPNASTVTSISNLPGTVQAVSANAQFLVIYDSTQNAVTIYNVTSNSVRDRFVVTGVPNPCKTATSDLCPQASFTPDNQTVYVVAGPNLYVSTGSSTLKTIPLGTAANDVAVTAQGSFAFVANGDATIVPYATCNNSKISGNTVTATGPVQKILSAVDGSTLYGVAPPSLNIISPATNAVGCVPSLTDPLSSVDLGQGAFNIRQVLRSTPGNRLYVVTGGNSIVGYDKGSNAGFAIGLSASANGLSGGLTPDGSKIYVGGSDNRIHIIDTSTNAETGTMSVSFTPDLVAVRPQ